MTDKSADQIKTLYTELAKVAPSQDWDRILRISKKILGFSVNEKKAFHCKVVALIHLDKFDEAYTSIERNPDASDLIFEKAYCEYRTNKLTEAYETLLKCKEMGNKEKELLAQVTYRLEKYEESYDAYRDLVKNIDDDFDAERQTNMSAVVASMRYSTPTATKDLDMVENEKRTYELCYNSACLSLSKGNYSEAENKLQKAESMCREMFEETDGQEAADESEVENELAVIRVQLAYCLQKMGKADEALKVYNNVMKIKPTDLSVMAVASNNLVCINKDQNVFDSKKRLKAATSAELDLKLNSKQRRLIAYNEILFSIITNQRETVNKLIDEFKKKFGESEQFALLKMYQLYKEKKYAEAENVLRNMMKAGQASTSSAVKLYLAQILLSQGKLNETVELLKTLDEFKVFKLGLVSALVTILKHLNNKTEITNIFASAIDHFNAKNTNSKEFEIYTRENSTYQIETGNWQKASEMLEKMYQLKPNDFKILSKLINIYSKFDAQKANKLSKQLPSLQDIIANSNLDIDALETQFSLLNFKTSKLKSSIASGQMKSPEQKAKSAANEKLKKKKKRKIRLPKNFNPNIPLDKERWLPLRERSYYKGKRNKKKNAIGKGTQGAVSSKDEPQSPRAENLGSPEAAKLSKLADKAKPKLTVQQKKKKKGPKW